MKTLTFSRSYVFNTCSSFFRSVLSRGGITYAIAEEGHTWLEALGKCLLLGGNLAVIDSLEEFNFLYQMLQQHRESGGTASGLWLDGDNSCAPGTWYCATRRASCPLLCWSSSDDQLGCPCVWYASQYSDGMATCNCTSDGKFPLCEFH